MGLPEKVIPRRYHALDYDWTPLSRNPCWLSNAVHRIQPYMRRNRPCLISSVGSLSTNRLLSTTPKLMAGCDKSLVDDLVQTGYCKRESSLCTTRRWGLSRVPMICSFLFPMPVIKAPSFRALALEFGAFFLFRFLTFRSRISYLNLFKQRCFD